MILYNILYYNTLCYQSGVWLTAGARDCTPEIDTSESIVNLSGIFQWTFSGISSDGRSPFQWHRPKDFHFSRCSPDVSVASSDGPPHVCMYVCIYIYICLYVCVYIYIYIYTYMYIHIYVYIHIGSCVNMYIYIYICICNVYMCVYIYIYIERERGREIDRETCSREFRRATVRPETVWSRQTL